MRLSKISSYPVKGCTAIDHDQAAVEPWGLAGDRRWLIVNPDGVALTQRDVATLALLRAEPDLDGLKLSFPRMATIAVQPRGEATTVTVWGRGMQAVKTDADAWVSEAMGRLCHLVWQGNGTFADEQPLLLTNTASLIRLNDWILEGEYPDEAPLPMTRFRPNVVITGVPAFAEDGWIGQTVHIGQTAYEVVGHCSRCLVTTTDQQTAERGREPLRVLAKHRKVGQQLRFGVHLVPVVTGTISLGDEVRVQAT